MCFLKYFHFIFSHVRRGEAEKLNGLLLMLFALIRGPLALLRWLNLINSDYANFPLFMPPFV